MSEGMVLDLFREAIYQVIINALPMLLISLVIGLIVSIFQTVTSIQEQTLTFVPKLIGILAGLLLFGSWIMNNIVEYVNHLWSDFSVFL